MNNPPPTNYGDQSPLPVTKQSSASNTQTREKSYPYSY